MTAKLGNRLRRLRIQKRWRIHEVAKRLGKSESWLSQVETGKIDLKTSGLEELADTYGVTADELLRDLESEEGPEFAKLEAEIVDLYARIVEEVGKERARTVAIKLASGGPDEQLEQAA